MHCIRTTASQRIDPPETTLYLATACHVQWPELLRCCAEERVSVMHPSQLAALLRDPGHVAGAVIQLRALLPLCNVSGLAALAPHLLDPSTLAELPDVRTTPCMLGFLVSMAGYACIVTPVRLYQVEWPMHAGASQGAGDAACEGPRRRRRSRPRLC